MTTNTVPLKIQGKDGNTGNEQTRAIGYVRCTRQVNLGIAPDNRKIITLPPNSTLLGLSAIVVSAWAGVDTAASSMNVNFGNSADSTHYGVVNVSAVVALKEAASVSAGNEFDSGGTIVVTLSALSTTTFTAGGVRAFAEYLTTE